jgi:MYXO-CTERM domain-containing protein
VRSLAIDTRGTMLGMRWLLGIVAAVMLVPGVPEARACSPAEPSLVRTYPAEGSMLPEGADLLLEGWVLRPELLTVAVDDQPAELLLVPERSVGFDHWGWDFAYHLMAFRIEPPPQPGQTIAITGDPCLEWKGESWCDEVVLLYTVGQADAAGPDAPADLWYDVYDHGMEVTDHQLCTANPPVRYEVTIDTEIERHVLEYPLEYRVSRRMRDAPGAWGLVAHDWMLDAEAHDPSLRWLFSLADVDTLLPLAEAWCLRLQTFDASENLGGEVEVCPPCHDQIEDEASFLAYWPSSSPSYDDEWRYPDGHCPEALERDDTTGTESMDATGDDESTASSVTSGEPDPETGSSSGSDLPASDLPDRGCACSSSPTGGGWASSGMLLGLLLLGFRRRGP